MASDCSFIREFLEDRNFEKWGYVIFRCTYADDVAWSNALAILNHNTQDRLEEDGETELLDRLDWVIIEDKETLDGADIATVRQ